MRDAWIDLVIYYADRAPIGPYRLTVPAERTRHVRINDLIDPEAVPLDVDYAVLVQSSVEIIVQFLRVDTGRAESSMASTMADPVT